MKKIAFLLIFFFLNATFLHSEEIKLTKITEGLESPWGLSFISQNEILITEKSGNIIYFNLEKQELKNIKHNLKILEKGQGGLLDILYIIKKYLFLIPKIEVTGNLVHRLQKGNSI